jgi:hypothetical protein
VRHRGAAQLAVRAIALHRPAGIILARARTELQARHRGYTRQRLATKPQAVDLLQIIQRGDLAGGVPRQRQRQFLAADTAAVIAHPDALLAALLDIHLDAAGAGIEAVFQQFLDHRGRPLDDLTGSDLVDQLGRQYLDGHGSKTRAAHEVAHDTASTAC